MYGRLKAIINERGYNVSSLAMKCGIIPSNLHDALKGGRRVYPKWRKAISKALCVSEDDIFAPYDEYKRGGGEL